jgi:hypothetical protein
MSNVGVLEVDTEREGCSLLFSTKVQKQWCCFRAFLTVHQRSIAGAWVILVNKSSNMNSPHSMPEEEKLKPGVALLMAVPMGSSAVQSD